MAGTTRDVIETHLNLDGYPVIISDTAGIRDSKDDIEVSVDEESGVTTVKTKKTPPNANPL